LIKESFTLRKRLYRHQSIINNNKLYIIGGITDEYVRNSVIDVYDFETKEWNILPIITSDKYNLAISFFNVVEHNEFLYIIAGYNGKHRTNITYKIYIGPHKVPSLRRQCINFIKKKNIEVPELYESIMDE
jgi:hypothetical protein